MPNINDQDSAPNGKSVYPFNVLGKIAAKPFYIWVNDDCSNKSDSFTEASFDYQLLARLQQDCDYYLGHGNRSKMHLWAGGEAEQIAKMKELYSGLKEKPEWISLDDIDTYEARMLNFVTHPSSGKTGTFAARFDQHADRNGQTFTLIGTVDPGAYDKAECGEMFVVRFADGVEIHAWPEEVQSALNAVDGKAQLAFDQKLQGKVSNYIETQQKDVFEKRIVGVFTKQAWGGRKGDDAIFVSDEQFDATDAVLKLSHAELIELQDNHESTDEIGRSIVGWDGPCEVRLVGSIQSYFGVESIEDVTPEMLAQSVLSLDVKVSNYIDHANESIQDVVDDVLERAKKYGFKPDEDMVREAVEESANLLKIELTETQISEACQRVMNPREVSNYIEHSDPTLFAKYAGPRALDETSIGDIPLHEQQAYWASLGESGEMTDDDANRLYAAWHAVQASFSGLSAPLEQREVSNYIEQAPVVLTVTPDELGIVQAAVQEYRELIASPTSADREARGNVWADREVAASDALLDGKLAVAARRFRTSHEVSNYTGFTQDVLNALASEHRMTPGAISVSSDGTKSVVLERDKVDDLYCQAILTVHSSGAVACHTGLYRERAIINNGSVTEPSVEVAIANASAVFDDLIVRHAEVRKEENYQSPGM